MDRNYDVITLISKYLYFKEAGVAIFADIINEMKSFLSKKCLKTEEKLKELEIMYQNAIYICIP